MEAKALTGKSYSRRRPETTLLYQTVADHLETFIAQRESDGKGLPPHVIEEFRAYLRCGQLHYGFMRVACSCCKYEGAVAYSCKKRGFCPSCAGKRMAESEQHLIENILPLLSPLELLEKLAALVPPPRTHQVRHFGVFGSHSQWRRQIVLKPEKRKGFAPDGGYDRRKVKNTLWARMLARTFGVDVSLCPECGGEMRVVA